MKRNGQFFALEGDKPILLRPAQRARIRGLALTGPAAHLADVDLPHLSVIAAPTCERAAEEALRKQRTRLKTVLNELTRMFRDIGAFVDQSADHGSSLLIIEQNCANDSTIPDD